MSTEGSAPEESSPSTPISTAAARAAAAAALAGTAAASAPAASQFLFAFDDVDEMDHYDRDSPALDKADTQLCYTGGKNEDRALFIRRFVEMVGKVQRVHEARVRRHMRSAAFHSLSPQAKKAFIDSKPDYRSLWDLLPSLLAGDDHSTSVAYDWWCASYLKDGLMASHACRVLKDLTTRDSYQGSVRCAQPPFHKLAPGATWAVCKRFQEGDVDGERSDEWENEGTSTKGLTGADGTEDSHYFWALRAFVAELEAKFLMKGTKEKEDLLVAKSQTAEQDGLAYVKSCRRRESALNAGKSVGDSIVRQDVEECIKGLRIKEYRDRVSEQLRVSHPAPNKVTWDAVVWAVRTLRQYLHGVHFTLVTDHSPLTTLMEKADLQGQHLRWAISLQEFDFTVQYRPGAKNSNADVPSRYPLPSTMDETGARHEREKVTALHAGVGEVCTKGFCDYLCFMLAGDVSPGEEATPEVQVANYCKRAAVEQLGTGPVHRLFDVHHQEELECNHVDMFDTDLPELVTDSGRLARAAWKALSLVRPTRGTHGEGSPAVYSNEYFEGERILKPEKVDTRVLGRQFFSQAREEGVVCYEPCGGLCAGLEMLLHNGMKVDPYLYQDISPSSQTVARARCTALLRRYPDLTLQNRDYSKGLDGTIPGARNRPENIW
ncbi:hypothetical protein CYMTET_4128 [Cymbomonas tetramitiformis]|uniref:Reverse transcriptase RNase H-like domain-containing protein n=1 Tax=Cymbomonas tetramitiformis TaxID=36881 RepID=A0AAE0LKC7_9CHLO|nr:hypothetical protein CYMTET_4128 [Cymbomonas tetramitiformis]